MSDGAAKDQQQEPAGSAAEKPGIEDALPLELIEQLGAWLRQVTVAGSELANLFRLELQLTLGDARRLVMVGIVLLPMLILCWIALGVLVSWLAYSFTASVTLALTVFFLLQMAAVGFLISQAVKFKRQMGFRRTKAHAHQLMQGAKGETPSSD